MQLKPGTRLRSSVCETQVIVVKAPGAEVELTCGGAPMWPLEADAGATDATGTTVDPAFAGKTLLGKRYADEQAGIELLCTKAGEGSLAIGGQTLGFKEAKPLPSSD
jgi:hypothetical protein